MHNSRIFEHTFELLRLLRHDVGVDANALSLIEFDHTFELLLRHDVGVDANALSPIELTRRWYQKRWRLCCW